jgi:hypothetical protein
MAGSLCNHHCLQENRADIWDNANALAVVVGGTSDDLRYLKSISLHLWLFGYELPGELLVLLLLRLLLPSLLPCMVNLLVFALLGITCDIIKVPLACDKSGAQIC